MQGLYIHIPFCVSKCGYCDFASFQGLSSLINPYLKALAKEAALNKNKIEPKTLYIGGGTPSSLSLAQIKTLCNIIQDNFGKIKNFKEASFECNPESVTEEKIKLLKQYGFTRLSLGMQVMSDKHLKLVGRAHNVRQFLSAVKIIKKYFDNFSIDLIAGLPQQTLQDFKDSFKQTILLSPKHLSVYGLQVEEGTPLHASGFINDDALTREMLEYTQDILSQNDYNQYEISNYSLKGFESLHNINYWKNGQYLGLGSAAASYIKGARSVNTADVKEYIKLIDAGKKPLADKERLTGKAKAGESVILALRMTKGLRVTEALQKLFGKDFKELEDKKLIIKTKNNIRLSKEGIFFANEVFRHFVEPF